MKNILKYSLIVLLLTSIYGKINADPEECNYMMSYEPDFQWICPEEWAWLKATDIAWTTHLEEVTITAPPKVNPFPPDVPPIDEHPFPEGGNTQQPVDPFSIESLKNTFYNDDLSPKISDMDKYKKCFDDGKEVRTYTLTLYIDQPVANSNDQWVIVTPEYALTNPSAERGIMIKTQNTDLDVGHTFVCFEKNNMDGTNVRQTMGFYPDPDGSHTDSKGVIKDNSGHAFDVSYTITVTEAEFKAALNAVNRDFVETQYDLLNYNCTDAGLRWMNAGGAGLSSVSRGVFNNTPGDIGQALRNNSNANKNSGHGATGKGPCN